MELKFCRKFFNIQPFCERLIFYSYLLCFKISGLAPFEMKISCFFNNQNKHETIKLTAPCKVSDYAFIYNALLLISMTTYFVVLYLSPSWEKIYIHSCTLGTIGKGLIILGATTSVIIWFIYILKQSVIVSIANEIYRVNNALKRCKHYELKTNYFIYFIFIGNFIMCFFIMLVGIATHEYVSVPFWSIPCILVSWVIIQYTITLIVINQNIACLNEMLLKLGNVDTKIKFQKLFVTKFPLREAIILDIINMNHANKKLCKICNDAANFFTIPILSAIIYFAMTTIYELRYLFLAITNKSYGTIPPFLIHLDSVSWFVIVLFDLTAFTSSVTSTTREFKKTALYIHLLLDRCTMDLPTEKMLIEFSRDLLHRNVEFTAFHITVLDGSLLHSFFGTIVTYLIILTQFRVR
ncbi:putative gustatory receptor 28a [Cotesia glomerata]|uniref:putative gustatory receptor 28a n=1 Tax=Cotesia glomerata TaxID=32391 RepID=UPI001D00330C|nr:putative gustatory receptor 28a [Cotesia glomerata]